MLLGRKAHGAGNKIRYAIDYNTFLEEGTSLASGDVSLATDSTATDVTISGAGVTPSNHIVFFLAGGSISEVFTVDVVATDSRGEIKNDTMEFFVVA